MAGSSQHIRPLLARSNGQTLYEHTKEVWVYALQIYGNGVFKNELELAALLHDIGKAQDKYQNYFKTGESKGSREHAISSAWISTLLSAIHPEINCVVTRLVESHHKGLEQSGDVGIKVVAISHAENALKNITGQNDPILDLLKMKGIHPQDLKNVCEALQELKHLASSHPTKMKEIWANHGTCIGAPNIEALIDVRKALGALVVADSISAANLTPKALTVQRKTVTRTAIQRFLSKRRTNRPIDRIRAVIGQYVEQIARNADLSKKIYTIALPTGAGKTLHSLRFATILRERIQKELNQEPPRIIYVMPFTTIIDQAYDILMEIYGDLVEKRHYLAEERPRGEVPEEIANVVNLLYPSEITVTTYVQFYSALTGNGRRDAIRALAMRNRIIILDEVQAIPHAHWDLMRELIRAISKENWIVLMSATVPKYVVPESATKIIDPTDIPDRSVFHRHTFRRVKYSTYRDVVKDAVDKYLSGKSVAIVLNTVRTAEDAYLTAKDLLNERGLNLVETVSGAYYKEGSIVYLSTYVPPFARKARIHRFNGHVLAITTQIIEAGVDVSVDVLYRELAPVDSTVQAAGRCNRNGEQEYGEVIIFETEETKDTFTRVYGKNMYAATTAALEGVVRESFNDEDVEDILKMYFRSLRADRESENVLERALKSVENCDFTLNVKIIESVPKHPVVVMYPGAKRIVEQLKALYKQENRDRKAISKHLRQLGTYIVNVYPKQTVRFEPLEIGNNVFYAVRPGDRNNYKEDVGVLYNPENDPHAFEDRLA